jgi:hypothetical protein
VRTEAAVNCYAFYAMSVVGCGRDGYAFVHICVSPTNDSRSFVFAIIG